MWPVDYMRIISVPHPKDVDDVRTLVSVEGMQHTCLDNCRDMRDGTLSDNVDEVRRGFLNTTCGLVLRSDGELASGRRKAEEFCERELTAEAQINAKESREMYGISREEMSKWVVRARLAKMGVAELRARARPLCVRRRITEDRTATWHEAVEVMTVMAES